MVVYILNKIEDIVHVIVSPLFIDLVAKEVPPSILGLSDDRNPPSSLDNYLQELP